MKKQSALFLISMLCFSLAGCSESDYLGSDSAGQILTEGVAFSDIDEYDIEQTQDYYNFSDDEKKAYGAIYNGIAEKEEYIKLPHKIKGDSYEKIYLNIEKQEPELFYIANEFYTSEYIKTAHIIYKDNSDFLYSQKDALKSEIDRIVRNADEKGDFEKLLYFHDYIAQNCSYIEQGEDVATAYGCIIGKKANCEGYSKAFKYLCDNADIPCVVVVGKSDNENHAWNQVQINGIWYNIDVTWDDYDDDFELVHSYFMCSDDDFVRHTPDIGLMPVFECHSKEENYYIKNDLFIATQDDAERILFENLKNVSKVIELKCSNEYIYNEFKEIYMT
ncbi:MAG: hypothetical protein K2G63_04970, partial [Oscillospiraceae bacterium]|nr:hypothetical protein [Oscillospiraceae bacterium]